MAVRDLHRTAGDHEPFGVRERADRRPFRFPIVRAGCVSNVSDGANRGCPPRTPRAERRLGYPRIKAERRTPPDERADGAAGGGTGSGPPRWPELPPRSRSSPCSDRRSPGGVAAHGQVRRAGRPSCRWRSVLRSSGDGEVPDVLVPLRLLQADRWVRINSFV